MTINTWICLFHESYQVVTVLTNEWFLVVAGYVVPNYPVFVVVVQNSQTGFIIFALEIRKKSKMT